MGGRVAAEVVAKGASVDALALFAYPLHPPGRPAQRRDATLSDIRPPMLFCSGTRDAFASTDELQELAARLPNASLHLLEHAEHGFKAPKASGRTQEAIWAEAVEALTEWLLTAGRLAYSFPHAGR